MQFLKYKLYLPMDEIKFSCEKHFQRGKGEEGGRGGYSKTISPSRFILSYIFYQR